jgi:tetratricopeptide (TPR) repeat protein
VLRRLAVAFSVLAAGLMTAAWAQNPSGSGKAPSNNVGDLEFVERVLLARRDYQKSLEALRGQYLRAGDFERAKWAEEELRSFHRIPHHAYRLDLDVPHPGLQGNTNIVEANRLYTEAMKYKDKGWGLDYTDNQRRAELLFQKILTQYPQSNKISDVAYQLGDVYESKAYKMYKRAAAYFERCFQWNPQTQLDARLRAARLYDRHLQERARAIEIYREITTHETDPKRLTEAQKRLGDLSGK